MPILSQPCATGHADAINTLKYSPDGSMLASGSADRHIFLWNAKTCEACLHFCHVFLAVAGCTSNAALLHFVYEPSTNSPCTHCYTFAVARAELHDD